MIYRSRCSYTKIEKRGRHGIKPRAIKDTTLISRISSHWFAFLLSVHGIKAAAKLCILHRTLGLCEIVFSIIDHSYETFSARALLKRCSDKIRKSPVSYISSCISFIVKPKGGFFATTWCSRKKANNHLAEIPYPPEHTSPFRNISDLIQPNAFSGRLLGTGK